MLINLSVKRNFRGTCSSVQMQKVYMVRKRLGTPHLKNNIYEKLSLSFHTPLCLSPD